VLSCALCITRIVGILNGRELHVIGLILQVILGANSNRINLSAGLKLPARMHANLQKMLQVLRCGHRRVDIRLPIYGALLSYLQISKPLGATSKSQPILMAILSGIPKNTQLTTNAGFDHLPDLVSVPGHSQSVF
jgi:hypothetical protein